MVPSRCFSQPTRERSPQRHPPGVQERPRDLRRLRSGLCEAEAHEEEP